LYRACSYTLDSCEQCILFIRDYNKKGQEISGYIDLAWRLKTEDFRLYFTHQKRLLPKPSDLSYYNWETQAYVDSVMSSCFVPNCCLKGGYGLVGLV